MSKSASVYARIEPEVKEQAEQILTTLGIPASNAITIFYKQIILHNGLPFDVTIPSSQLLDLNQLTEEALSRELDKGYANMKAGRTKPAKEVFDNLRKEYNL